MAADKFPIARFTALAQALHWVTVALVLIVLPLAWVAVSLPKGPGEPTMPPPQHMRAPAASTPTTGVGQ